MISLQMTNEIGKAIFRRAGELNVPVGFMCMKVFSLFFSFPCILNSEELSCKAASPATNVVLVIFLLVVNGIAILTIQLLEHI